MVLFRTTERALRALLLMFVVMVLAPGFAQSQSPSPQGVPSRLIGIIRSGTFTGAVLGDATGAQFFYRLRDELPDGSRIVAVEDGSIRLKRSDGTVYELFISHDMNTSAVPVGSPAASSAPPASIAPAPAPSSRQPGGDNPARPMQNRRKPQRGINHSEE